VGLTDETRVFSRHELRDIVTYQGYSVGVGGDSTPWVGEVCGISGPPLLECRVDRVNLSAVLRALRRVPFCVHHQPEEEVLKRVKGMHDALLD
jgi:hypothetical protein